MHFSRYVDFRGRSGAQENLYFRRRWLRQFGTPFDMKQGFCEKYNYIVFYMLLIYEGHTASRKFLVARTLVQYDIIYLSLKLVFKSLTY